MMHSAQKQQGHMQHHLAQRQLVTLLGDSITFFPEAFVGIPRGEDEEDAPLLFKDCGTREYLSSTSKGSLTAV